MSFPFYLFYFFWYTKRKFSWAKLFIIVENNNVKLSDYTFIYFCLWANAVPLRVLENLLWIPLFPKFHEWMDGFVYEM